MLGAHLSCRGRCIQRKPLHLKDGEKLRRGVLMREGFVERSWCFRTGQFSYSGPGWLLKSLLSGDIRQTKQRNFSPWSHWLTPFSWVRKRRLLPCLMITVSSVLRIHVAEGESPFPQIALWPPEAPWHASLSWKNKEMCKHPQSKLPCGGNRSVLILQCLSRGLGVTCRPVASHMTSYISDFFPSLCLDFF